MAFVDEARIEAVAGAGGDGVVAWHHEPYKPKGGPDGGDGGDGGDVVLRADPAISTLLEVRDRPHLRAGRGGHGRGKRRHGARGSDRVQPVPVGTLVYDEAGVLLADLATPGAEVVVARGGRGGRGNASFATATSRAPAHAEKGEPGERRTLRLELRLLADVGLVGFPNAGKSTLIARISSARPKIADYPFTTLIPKLGVVRVGDLSFTVADIPGLIPGAHRGKGLGDRFLRHIHRAAVLVLLVDLAAPDRDPAGDVDALRRELAAFDPDLAARPQVIVANKVDAGRDRLAAVRAAVGDVAAISAVTGEGVAELLRELAGQVSAARQSRGEPEAYVRLVDTPAPLEVTREGAAFRVTGAAVERAVARADLDNDEAVARLQRRLVELGVETELIRAGARPGDEIRIGDVSFDLIPDEATAGR